MKIVGIIAEYNPFHNGHAYQIAKAKELTGADFCMIVMSGNFVQRGAPAMLDKNIRVKSALLCGADLVLELPVHYSCASAEYFAAASVALLDKLGVCDYLCFGSESGDIKSLTDLSAALLSESDAFRQTLKKRLKSGDSYPQAREKALLAHEPALFENLPLLRFPNNILGIEYLKAIQKRESSIKAYTIPRKDCGYHDGQLPEEGAYGSALAIREAVLLQKNIRSIKEQVPDAVYGLLTENYEKTFPILPSDFSSMLFYKLLTEQTDGFTGYFGVDASFSDRIRSHLLACADEYTDFNSLCESLKTKNTTYTKVARNLLHILLSVRQADMDAFCKEDYVYYARALGFRKEASPLLSNLKANSSIPILTKPADAIKQLPSQNGIRMFEQNVEAAHIYAFAAHHKFGGSYLNEYKRQIVII